MGSKDRAMKLGSLLQEIFFPPTIMNVAVRMARPALMVATRQLSTSQTKYALPAGYLKLKETQKAWAIDDGKRVHEKGGPKDKIVFNITRALVLVGAVMWVQTVYTMSFPQK